MPKQQTIVREVAGLITQPNPETAPEGAYHTLENCVCSRQDVVEKRRGFERYKATTLSPSQISEFKDRLIFLDGTTLKYDSDGAGTWASYTGSYSCTDQRMRTIEAVKSLYFTSDTGEYRIDSLTGTPYPAGMPAALDVQLTAYSGTWMPENNQVAYRVVWVRKDINGRPILGYPSHQVVFSRAAAAGSTAITVTTTLPDSIVAGDWLWVYRTELSGGETDDPGDEEYLVAEVLITAQNRTDGYIAWNDEVVLYDDSTPLYTNPTQETITQGNDNPPLCRDIAFHKEFVWFANTQQEQYLMLRMLGLTGVANTDTVTIGGETYTFAAAENEGSKNFQLFTGGTPSENLRDTCQSLCKIINRTSANLYGFYVSQPTENPGRMEIRARTFGVAAFSMTANDAATGAAFSPSLPTTGTDVTSTNDVAPNRLYHSRLGLPDAVPYLNYDDVGDEDNKILRIIPLQDSLIIIKQVGIYRLTGDDPSSFSIKVLDPQIRCFAPDSWVPLNNQAIGLSDQGVVQASEAGVAIISFPMEGELKKIFSYSGFESTTFGTAYPSDRLYIIWTPETSGDTYAKLGWCFNFLTEKWSGPWRKNVQCSHVLRDQDQLYLGKADEAYILVDRKSYTTNLTDYSDESIPCTITASGTTLDSEGETVSTVDVTFTYSLITLSSGWYFKQSVSSSRVESVTTLTPTTYRLTLRDELFDLALGAAELEIPIISICRWKPETAGNPAINKDWSRYQISMEDDSAQTHQVAFHSRVGFSSDILSDISYYDITTVADKGWGIEEEGWGEFGWGDEDPSVQPVLFMTVPTQFRRSRSLTTIYKNSSARERFAILSSSITFRTTTEITSR
jgi:hypothetical protein